ncbi:hypothetical protein [Streptomyces minutiscleroticus]|uniref:hypothetical protein n=1 Tax=Streptomyces minutiscleroticus TaxID=68238 RepID=UPI00332067EC
MSYGFQDPTLLPRRPIRANADLVAELQGVPRAERRERAQKANVLVGLRGSRRRTRVSCPVA